MRHAGGKSPVGSGREAVGSRQLAEKGPRTADHETTEGGDLGLSPRDFDGDELPGQYFFQVRLNQVRLPFQGWPVVGGQQENGNLPALEILLILQIAVAGEK